MLAFCHGNRRCQKSETKGSSKTKDTTTTTTWFREAVAGELPILNSYMQQPHVLHNNHIYY